MSEQLTFDLPHLSATGAEDYMVSVANQAACDVVEAWPAWPAPALVLCGPAGSGKSHLAAIWAGRSGARRLAASELTADSVAGLIDASAVAVEDIDRGLGDEQALFHLLNLRLGRVVEDVIQPLPRLRLQKIAGFGVLQPCSQIAQQGKAGDALQLAANLFHRPLLLVLGHIIEHKPEALPRLRVDQILFGRARKTAAQGVDDLPLGLGGEAVDILLQQRAQPFQRQRRRGEAGVNPAQLFGQIVEFRHQLAEFLPVHPRSRSSGLGRGWRGLGCRGRKRRNGRSIIAVNVAIVRAFLCVVLAGIARFGRCPTGPGFITHSILLWSARTQHSGYMRCGWFRESNHQT